MTFPKARMIVSACLFIAWIGFLFYLVIDSPKVLISKPQFLIASVYVVADLQSDDGKAHPEVAIDSVIWSANGAPSGKVMVLNLARCGEGQGFRGPGKYVLPLLKSGDSYQLASMPNGEYRIYPPSVRPQVDALIAAR